MRRRKAPGWRLPACACSLLSPHKNGRSSRDVEAIARSRALRLPGEMRCHSFATVVRRAPAQATCEEIRKLQEIGHDAGESPIGEGDVRRMRRGRQAAHGDVDAGRLVLAM